MKTCRLTLIILLSFGFHFILTAQEKNTASSKKYASKTIWANPYPKKGALNLSSSVNKKTDSAYLHDPTLSNAQIGYPKIVKRVHSVLNFLLKSQWTNDISIFKSEYPEKNPAILGLETEGNNPEIIVAVEEWNSFDSPNLLKIIKSNDHGFSWIGDSVIVISDVQSSLSNPKLTQISDSSFCVVFQRNWSELNQDIYIAKINNDFSTRQILPVDPAPIKNSNPNIISDYVDYKDSTNIYLVYYQIDGDVSKLIFRKSKDNGYTWSYFELATINTPDIPYCSISYQQDVLSLAFTHKTGISDDVIVFVSTDRGENWDYFSFVAYANQHERFPEVSVADSLYIFVMYENWYTEADRDILYAYSENSGSSWQINNALSLGDDDERFPVIKIFPATPEIYTGFVNLTTNNVMITNALYQIPSFWVEPYPIKNNFEELSLNDPITLLPKLSPQGENGISAAWCQNENNADVYFNASWETTIFTISGTVKTELGDGINQVVMQGLPNSPVTDSTGFFMGQVSCGWSGSVTPQKEGWEFKPSSILYKNLESDQIDQNYQGTKLKILISGFVKDSTNTPVEDVILKGLTNMPATDSTGFYADSVFYGWSGVVTPEKAGWEFLPLSLTYENLVGDQIEQNYRGAKLKYLISGFVKDSTNTPLEDVILKGLPNIPATDSTGFYVDSVVYGWTGVVTPEKDGWEFIPKLRVYQNVMSDQTDQSYISSLIKIEISGVVSDSSGNPIQDVKLNGLPNNPNSDYNGFYSDSVYYGWSGSVNPVKLGLLFSPQNRVYTEVIQDQKEQNYQGSIIQYNISGQILDSVNLPNADVVLTGLPGNPKTDLNGFYSAVVPSGWNGFVTPQKEGWEFVPSSKEYLYVLSDQPEQNYSCSLRKLIISGYLLTVDDEPIVGILLEGLPQNPLTDLQGFYSDSVSYGWSGIIKPKSSTLQFSPTERIFTNLKENQINQNFIGSTIQYKISGFIKDSLQKSLSEVALIGFPGETKTDSTGYYSAIIPVNWSGSVNPQKEGWRFTPSSKQYNEAQSDYNEENYVGILKKYVISGFTVNQNQEPIIDVLINGLPKNPNTDANGFFSDSVFYNWSGSIVPQKEGWNFSPFSKTFQNIVDHQKNQNFLGSKILITITGYVRDAANNPITSVVLQGLPNNPSSDTNGFYSDTLLYNWSGVVTPNKEDWEFSPASKIYNNVISGLNEENYIGNMISNIQENKKIPETYFLSQNYPNPFSSNGSKLSNIPVTNIEFGIPATVFVTAKIYDVTGREVAQLVNKTLHTGFHKIEWKSKDLPSGTYFLLFQAKDFREVKKVVLLR